MDLNHCRIFPDCTVFAYRWCVNCGRGGCNMHIGHHEGNDWCVQCLPTSKGK